MPPFAGPPRILHINAHLPPPADDELDSPIESLSNMSLNDEATDALNALPKPNPLKPTRPELTTRSSTEPSPTALPQGYFTNTQPQRPTSSNSSSSNRNRSPYSRSHLRSRSSGAALLSAPMMTRAHSLPNPHISRTPAETAPATPSSSSGSGSGSGSLSPGAPRSPMRSPRRVHSPLRTQQAEEGASYVAPPPRSPGFASGGAIESIQEETELSTPHRHNNTSSSSAAAGNPTPPSATGGLASFSRSGSLRRRPASPLHSLANSNQAQQQQQQPPTSFPASVIDANTPIHHTPSSGSSSPSLGPQKASAGGAERYNESYPPLLHHYASTSSFSSMPSTPTSARSRSPSISSLETIEDAPDLEGEAIESERIERLKLAAERQERMERGEDVSSSSSSSGDEGVGMGVRRRSSLEGARSGFGRSSAGGASRGERKRWSICGGERRGDLDLETIWED